MSEKSKSSELKHPFGIYIIAVLFMIAPLGNILISFAGSGVENWYTPSMFVQLLATIPATDWLWLAGVFISGVALLIRHKTTWMFAVVVLLLVLGMNTMRAFNLEDAGVNPEFVRAQILISIFVTFSVLIIAFYARFPYLDRRQQWLFPTAHRYFTPTPVYVGIGEGVMAIGDSISSAGVRLRMPRFFADIQEKQNIDISFPEFHNLKVQTRVVYA
ncbi:MAG: PilZ domain-containing protein, partial [Proteobacteria bacterium]